MTRGLSVMAVFMVLLTAGCSGGNGGGEDVGDGSSGGGKDYTVSSSEYYEAMKVGKLANLTNTQLDTVGMAFCKDLAELEEKDRKVGVLAIRSNNPELSELEAFQVGAAMSGRYCPEFGANFDLDELKKEFGG